MLKFDQRVQLLIDGAEVERRKVPKRLNILSTAYVGGLPETNSGGILSFRQSNEGFKGCLRSVRVNGKPQDLVGPRGSSHNVGQCFPRVETGSFFPGDAFAVYRKLKLAKQKIALIMTNVLQSRYSMLDPCLSWSWNSAPLS